MTSGKLSHFRKIARESWKKGIPSIEITKEEIQAFNTGFNMAWRSILIDNKLYKTFNLYWLKEKLNTIYFYTLLDNDNNHIAGISIIKIDRFKYSILAYVYIPRCYKPYYNQVVDQTDLRRIKKELKAKILNDFIRTHIIETEQLDLRAEIFKVALSYHRGWLVIVINIYIVALSYHRG